MAILKGNRQQDGYVQVNGAYAFVDTSMKDKNKASVLRVYGTPGTTVLAGGADGCEISQGAAKIEFYRGAGYPFLSTGATTAGNWGGAEDCACRINVGNYAANTPSYGGMRALRVYARQYSGGSMANIYAALIDADDRGTSSGGASCAVIQTLTVAQRINTICSTTSNILVVQDNTQGTITPTTCTGTAVIKIQSTQPIASGARATAIHFETTGSGSGWTHAFSFQTATGLEGFTSIADGTQAGNVNGYIKIYDVAGTQTLYIPCYDAAPSA